ncbi:MAG TPA: FecR domain-containing protein, partial [Bacteroidales bacterium]|nr:FecR domain-containing protein [Bacteroidales bacterium]
TKLGKPFIVDAGRTSVKVLGTHFNVKNYASSVTQVYVEEGSVLFSDAQNDKNATTLKAGEMGLFKGESTPIEKMKTANGNAWLTKKLNFENSTLEQVKTDISNYFGQTVVLPNGLSRCLFTGEFSDPNITNVLDVVSFSVGCKYTIRNDSVYFEGEGCN